MAARWGRGWLAAQVVLLLACAREPQPRVVGRAAPAQPAGASTPEVAALPARCRQALAHAAGLAWEAMGGEELQSPASKRAALEGALGRRFGARCSDLALLRCLEQASSTTDVSACDRAHPGEPAGAPTTAFGR